MKEQLLKTSGADVLSSRKKTQTNLGGEWHPPPLPPLYVRGLSLITLLILRWPFQHCRWILLIGLLKKLEGSNLKSIIFKGSKDRPTLGYVNLYYLYLIKATPKDSLDIPQKVFNFDF